MISLSVDINKNAWKRAGEILAQLPLAKVVGILALVLAVAATTYSFVNGYVTSYGDAESHLNIAKRVVDSLTPGFAQLGGIWLPLPHLLMAPLVYFDKLWRTGLAGSIISGLAFIVSSVYIYKVGLLIGRNKGMAFVASLIFMLNPNILYLQSTPMTEVVLIAFFALSTYYFIRFIESPGDTAALISAAFFGFCAALSRYDGWFLVCVEAGIIGLMYLPWKRIPRSVREFVKGFTTENWRRLEGKVVLFGTLAFFGIALWLFWDWIILGDPLYFTHSQFSAKSQQNNWLARGELPSYHNPWLSFVYYTLTAMANTGVVLFVMAVVGVIYFIRSSESRHKYYVLLILLVPYIFNVLTLFLGQSVIFLPNITPTDFEWRLFNVRYGVMSVPLVAIAIGYLFYKVSWRIKILIAALFAFQMGLYVVGYSRIVSLDDGIDGLSSAVSKEPDAQKFIEREYDGGLVLVDDYARTLSIIRSGIPMKNIIYVGNKPYWPESLKTPEKYATWLVMQKDDEVWRNLYDNPETQGRMFKYFNKVYTAPEILIFKRNPEVPAPQ